MLRDDTQSFRRGERQLARRPLIQQDAQRVQVGSSVDRPPLQLFRRQVEDRAGDDPVARDARGGRQRQAEVGQLDRPFGRSQDVLRLDVTMNDPLLVGVAQRQAQLRRHGDRLGQVGRRPAEERLAVDQLHDDVGLAVDFAGVVDGHDVGMVEAGRQAGLVQQPLAVIGGQVRLAHNLDRHRAVQQLVVGSADDGHPAAAELGAEAVAVVEQTARFSRHAGPSGGHRGPHPVKGRVPVMVLGHPGDERLEERTLRHP
jgi:hypothetical protein